MISKQICCSNDGVKREEFKKSLMKIVMTHTWCHCAPADTPTLRCRIGISFEEHLDQVAPACELGWKGRATGLSHQSCPVSIGNSQVVVAVCSVECGGSKFDYQSLLHFDCCCLCKAVRIGRRVVWRCDNTCGASCFKLNFSVGPTGNCVSTTHPPCTLQDKNLSIARVRPQWLSQMHRR